VNELKAYTGTLPYASELFGVYQPLLGWKSRRTAERYEKYRSTLYHAVARRLITGLQPTVAVRLPGHFLEANAVLSVHLSPAPPSLEIDNLEPLHFLNEVQPYIAPTIDSAVARLVSQSVGMTIPADWRAIVDEQRMAGALQEIKTVVMNLDTVSTETPITQYVRTFLQGAGTQDRQAVLQSFFERECSIAGYLSFLAEHSPSGLTEFFFKGPKVDVLSIIRNEDPLINFGANNYDALLSPVGIVHLYREYFFEFDSFLGPPVGHVWLSPGGTVELIEVSTRKVFTERTLEQSTETVARSETQETNQDDLADAVKEENRNDVRFGFSYVAHQSSPFFEDTTATASFSLDSAKMTSRETTHKQMRQQSEKLSSEIKKSFKTTFRTSTEVTDTSSRRYVMQNTTDKLVNYELRRKMRKVGVQVQDIGTQLCWDTFVDDPGQELGIAKLVHIAKPAELGDLPQPDQIEMPKTVQEERTLSIPFAGRDTDDNDNGYKDGTEADVGLLDGTEHIVADFPQSVNYKLEGYTLSQVTLDPQGADAQVSVRDSDFPIGSSSGKFTVHLDYVHFHGQPSISIKATCLWGPSDELKNSIDAENKKRLDSYSAEKARRFKQAFYDAARERIKVASKVQPRPAEELREEERTVIYRALISQLMRVGTAESKHVTSELIRSLFDVEKMLYFVAPEWWAPRLHRSGQHLGEEPGPRKNPSVSSAAPGNLRAEALLTEMSGAVNGAVTTDVSNAGTPVPSENIVDWGGGRESGRDNYYITEESSPAKLGSSLGWLLQLDADNMRNAVLNSPWVKAVIPIRLGKEKQAINWLQQANVEDQEGLDSLYVPSADDPPELQVPGLTVRQALDFLIGKIQDFNRRSRTVILPNPGDPEDPRNHFAGSMPTEAVFEHGFYPLQGGVRFDQDGTEQAIFSQWLEILPTDQVPALQVEYDPKTLQVIQPEDR
jgi:hypothetical protein